MIRKAAAIVTGVLTLTAAVLAFTTITAATTVRLEAQGWWIGAGVNTTFPGAHLHQAVTWPYRATVSGQITVHVDLLMHNNPGTYTTLRVHTQDQDNLAVKTLNWTPGSVPVATQSFDITLDTTKASHDGWQEIRFLGIVKEPTGQQQEVSSGYQLDIRNGKPVSNYRGPDGLFTEARGWYTGAEYTIARIDSLIPTAPITGVWTPHAHMKPGAGGAPVTFHGAYIDPDFHNGSNGLVILQGAGQYIGNLTIDTARLAPGAHKLVLRADAQISTGTNSGLLVIPFTVGGVTSPSATPSPTITFTPTPTALPTSSPTPTTVPSVVVTPSPTNSCG